MSTLATTSNAKVILAPELVVAQRRHVLMVSLPSMIGTLVIIPWSYYFPPTIDVVGVAVALLYLTMGIGISVGFHRLLSHRSFETSSLARALFAILGSLAGQGPVTSWISIHRRHHEHTDTLGDPHSPHVCRSGPASGFTGLWHSHFGWLLNYESPNPIHYCPDLLKDRPLMFVSRWYLLWVAIGILMPGAIGYAIHFKWSAFAAGVLWGGFLRLFVSSQLTWAINSCCHIRGSRRYDTPDESRNNPILGLIVFGEGWHNNHHHVPSSAALGHRWYEVDFGYLFIRTMASVGLAWKVRRPHEESER